MTDTWESAAKHLAFSKPSSDFASSMAETPSLPFPLTAKILEVALSELPEGTRRATETCLHCWKEHKFTAEDFLSFVSSIAGQSATLSTALGIHRHGKDAWADSLNSRTKFADQIQKPKQPAISVEVLRQLTAPKNVAYGKGEVALDMSAKLVERRKTEAKRRQLDIYPGTYVVRRNRYLSTVIRKLSDQLPGNGKLSLLRIIRNYLAQLTSPEHFVEELRQLVDDFGAVVALDYTPECAVRSALALALGQPANAAQLGKRYSDRAAADAGAAKRCRGAAAAAPLSVGSASSGSDGGCGSSAGDAASPQDWAAAVSTPAAPAAVAAAAAAAIADRQDSFASLDANLGADDECGSDGAGGGDGSDGGVAHGWFEDHPTAAAESPLSSAALRDTPLGIFLTSRAQAASRRGVTVKVVAETAHAAADGCSAYVCKAIFAFQEVESAGEVALFGMYVHEFGPDAGADAGRVLVECIDSIPLMESETGEERQQLLTALIHGYAEAARRAGFRRLHLRVPPAAEECGHIFNARNPSVRAEATARMGHWYRRLLEAAVRAGLVASFRGAARLAAAEADGVCPASILPPGCADLERREDAAAAAAAPPAKPSGRASRFFVADLCAAGEEPPPLQPHPRGAGAGGWWGGAGAPAAPASVAAARLDFVAACRNEHLSFTSLSAAKFSTMYLLSRMVMDQLHGPCGGAHRRRAARGGLDDDDCSDGGDDATSPPWHGGHDDGEECAAAAARRVRVKEEREDDGGEVYVKEEEGGGDGSEELLLALEAGGSEWGDEGGGCNGGGGGGGRAVEAEMFADSLFCD